MNPIIGMTDILLGSEKDPKRKELLSDVPEFRPSDAGSGKRSDRVEPDRNRSIYGQKTTVSVETYGFLGKWDGLHAGAQAKGLSLSIETSDQVPDILVGDAHILSTILKKILDNAIKYSDSGQIKVSVSKGED